MQPVLSHNTALKERILSILEKNTIVTGDSNIARLLVTILDINPTSIELAVDLLMELKRGIDDKM